MEENQYAGNQSPEKKGGKNHGKAYYRVMALVEGAIMVALAQILSILKVWEMPQGGSVVLSMVPLVLYCVRWGLGRGLAACFVFGVLQFIYDGGFAIGWQSMLGDYFIAFMAIGFAGVMKGKKYAAEIGSVIGGLARFVVHYVVGATLWAECMPEKFFGLTMTSPWIYSALYNIAYMGVNIIVTVVVFVLLNRTPVRKFIRGDDLKRA